MNVPAGLPLKDALERFADPRLWQVFTSHFSSEAEAQRVLLKAFDDPGIIACYRARAAEMGDAEARSETAALSLTKPLIDDFWRRVEARELIMTCRQHPSLTRESFPIDLRSQLQFDLHNNSAVGNGYHLVAILVALAPEAAASDTAKRTTAWIEARRAVCGDEAKEALRHQARDKFGEAMSTRAFNEAYLRVYGRRRGRPPRSSGK
jgi:hypothetical protein